MNDREMELFVLAIKQAKALDDAYPDVGMGPSVYTLARDVANRLSFEVSEEDIEEACQRVRIQ